MERVNENAVRITYRTHLQYKMRKLFRYLLIIISITLLLATLTLIGLNIYGNIMLENAGRTEEWTDKDGVYFENSAESRIVFSFLYSFIIQSYSMFDILTKIAYEFEHLKKCDSTYAKLAASTILYGARTDLNIDPMGTVFEKCRTTSVIENLRNELVHNATWEMNPKIFIMTEAGQIIDRHILMPDFTQRIH